MTTTSTPAVMTVEWSISIKVELNLGKITLRLYLTYFPSLPSFYHLLVCQPHFRMSTMSMVV